MAVQAPDHEERNSPTRNFVGGSQHHGRTVWVAAKDADGNVHKINQDNASDWRARGPEFTILGLWHDNVKHEAAVAAAEADAADEAEAGDEDAAGEPEAAAAADEALNELNGLRKEAADLGVKVNDQWGKRRLRHEIDAAKLRAKQG